MAKSEEPARSPSSGDGGSLTRPLPTPTEMIAHLDRFVRGQAQAKRDLATAYYTHCMARLACSDPASPVRDFGKQHVLLLGPTGTGKSHVVRTLARHLNVPVAYVSATAMAETGYVGEKVESCIERLIEAAKGDPLRAQRGFVFVDEVDKIRRVAVETQRDVSGLGVQNNLLTLLDGRAISHMGVTIDSADVLFVFAGAFAGMEEILRRNHAAKDHVGFGRAPEAAGLDPSIGDLYRQVTREDLEEFGFVPELIGRFATVTVLDALSEEDLVAILSETEDSVLHKQRAYFALHGIDLELTPAALRAVARRAVRRQTGARGVASEVLRALDDVDWRPLELHEQGVVRIVVDAPTVERGVPPTLVTDLALAKSRPAPAAELRRRALEGPATTGLGGVPASPGISNSAGWSTDRLRRTLDVVRKELDWDQTTGSARKWWEAFEAENQQRLGVVLRLAEELRLRKATVTEFFLAYVYSNTDNIQANLHYLDYTRLKKEEERRKREAAQKAKGAGDPPATDGPVTPSDEPDDGDGSPNGKGRRPRSK